MPKHSRLTTFLFVASYFAITVQVGKTVVDLNSNNVAVGTILVVSLHVARVARLPRTGFLRIPLAMIVLAACVLYLTTIPVAVPGTLAGYALRAAIYLAVVGSTVLYAKLFFDDSAFLDTFWVLARISLVVAILGLALTATSTLDVLTHTRYGYPRMQGLLSEPSAWAPALASMILISLQKRSWPWLGMALIGVVFVSSPTVVLTIAISLPLYCVLTSRWSGGRIAAIGVAVAAAACAGTFLARGAGPSAEGTTRLDITVGRLISGVESVRTNGVAGSNTRFDSARIVTAELATHRRLDTGLGAGAADEYFPTQFGPEGSRANSLWLDLTFNFGRWLAAALMLALLLLLPRARALRSSLIFIPFIVAAQLNSATGSALFKFTLLAAVLFAAIGEPRRTSGVA